MADYRSERDQCDRNGEPSDVHACGFPSASLIVALYGGGAVSSLLLGFTPSLTSMQATNCLLISWLLALGALGMSILSDTREAEEADDDFDY